MGDTEVLIGPYEDELTKIISLAEKTGIIIEDPHSLFDGGYLPKQIISYFQEIVEGIRPIPKRFSPEQILEDPQELTSAPSVEYVVSTFKPLNLGRRDNGSWGHINRIEHVPEEHALSKRMRTEVSTLVEEEETQTTDIQQSLYPSRTKPHKTNYILDVARFGSHEKNLLFLAYGKEIVKKAIELYFGTPRNVHKEKALASGDLRNFQGGLVATMESMRTRRGYRRTEDDILNGIDVHEKMVSKYGFLKEPKMSLRKDLDLERYEALTYLVNVYILGKETNSPKALNLSFKPV